MGLTPVFIDPDTRPDGMQWNNICQFLNTYWIWYCYYEGLPRNHDTAKSLHTYLFHGVAAPVITDHSTKRAPVIRVLHRAMTQGRNRYGPGAITKSCTRLETYFKKHPKLLKTAFTSLRKDVPVEVLACVEDALRNLARGRGSAMGRNAMDSAENWEAVALFRKRDPFVAIVKHFLRLESFAIWRKFVWNDYILLHKIMNVKWV